MKTSCLRLKLVELNFLVSFNTDDQSKTDVANAINVITHTFVLFLTNILFHPFTIGNYHLLIFKGGDITTIPETPSTFVIDNISPIPGNSSLLTLSNQM